MSHIWQYTKLNLHNVGGVETHIRELSQALTQLGHHLYLGANNHPSFNLNEKIILHTHGDLWPDKTLIKLLKNKKIIWIHIAHGNTFERMNACNEWLSLSGWKGGIRDLSMLLLANSTIAVAEHAADEIKKYYLKKSNIKIIQNGVNADIFFPAKQISSNPKILFLGRHSDSVKNLDNLLIASKEIHKSNPGFQLMIAPDYDSTEPFIHNLGKCSSSELAKIFSEIRALVIPSFYEGDPLVAREAMAVGIPILASNIPALHETLAHYPLAFYFDPSNSTDIKNKITEILFENQTTIPTPIARSWAQVAEDYEQYYQSILN